MEGELEALEVIAKNPSHRVVGYYSHVNSELAEKARRMGISMVISRGAFANELEGILKQFGLG